MKEQKNIPPPPWLEKEDIERLRVESFKKIEEQERADTGNVRKSEKKSDKKNRSSKKRDLSLADAFLEGLGALGISEQTDTPTSTVAADDLEEDESPPTRKKNHVEVRRILHAINTARGWVYRSVLDRINPQIKDGISKIVEGFNARFLSIEKQISDLKNLKHKDPNADRAKVLYPAIGGGAIPQSMIQTIDKKLVIKDEGIGVLPDVTSIDFVGAGVSVVPTGSNSVKVEIDATATPGLVQVSNTVTFHTIPSGTNQKCFEYDQNDFLSGTYAFAASDGSGNASSQQMVVTYSNGTLVWSIKDVLGLPDMFTPYAILSGSKVQIGFTANSVISVASCTQEAMVAKSTVAKYSSIAPLTNTIVGILPINTLYARFFITVVDTVTGHVRTVTLSAIKGAGGLFDTQSDFIGDSVDFSLDFISSGAGLQVVLMAGSVSSLDVYQIQQSYVSNVAPFSTGSVYHLGITTVSDSPIDVVPNAVFFTKLVAVSRNTVSKATMVVGISIIRDNMGVRYSPYDIAGEENGVSFDAIADGASTLLRVTSTSSDPMDIVIIRAVTYN